MAMRQEITQQIADLLAVHFKVLTRHSYDHASSYSQQIVIEHSGVKFVINMNIAQLVEIDFNGPGLT